MKLERFDGTTVELTCRIRYSNQKNTLLTCRDGDKVYYGIFRCNLASGDRFNKKRGLQIAYERLKAFRERGNGTVGGDVSKNLLSGWCAVDEIKNLIRGFKAIDAIALEQKNKKWNGKTSMAPVPAMGIV